MEWCTVWKGSLTNCLGHIQDKHGGSKYIALNNLGKFFPPWTVPRDFGLLALRPNVSNITVDARLFHNLRCRLVHKYRLFHDPIPHPALRGAVFRNLMALVSRAMVIAQLTHLHITIPASGSVTEAVPEESFPPVRYSRKVVVPPRRVSFSGEVTVLGSVPQLSRTRPMVVLRC